MRIIPKPTFPIEEIYDKCVSGVRSHSVRKRLNTYRNYILDSAHEYEMRAVSSDLYLMATHGAEGATVPLVFKWELTSLYESQMAKQKRPGRETYEYLRNLAPMGLCPFCSISSARTLDHILPKAHYPNLSVLPFNLVPCCRDCNTEKRDEKITSIEKQKIHPYFDDLTTEQWLYADIVDCKGPVAYFRVGPPDQWDIKNKLKINSHLKTYDLDNRYGDLASCEINGIKLQMLELFKIGGTMAVKTELEERARSHSAAHLNSWQTALYQALSASNWYCQSGFS